MIRRFVEQLRGKLARRQATAPPEGDGAFLLRVLANEVATFDRQQAARESDEPYVLLTMAVPLPVSESGGWFGGAPRLPVATPWPVHDDGKALLFVCQIDLSALPPALWSGLGPRRGWLAVFSHPHETMMKVLHVDGPLTRRDGPGQRKADWFKPSSPVDPEPLSDHSPEWPVTITERTGDLPAPMTLRKGYVAGLRDPRDDEARDFADPALMPFDALTLTALLDAVAAQFDATRRWIDSLLKRKTRNAERDALLRLKMESDAAIEHFSRLRQELAPNETHFDLEAIGGPLSRLAAIPAPCIECEMSDEEGYTVFTAVTLDLRDTARRASCWYYPYARQLYYSAVHAYVRDPGALPPALRRRMEAIWRFESLHEQGGMGHAPSRHLYTPYGPDMPNVVLLELETSSMAGWIWGDCYSIVLFIARDDLARGDFDNVMCEISN